MPRARSGVPRTRRRNKILKLAKGYVMGRRRLYKTAKQAVIRAGVYAYRDRRNRKRDFRRLWILRIGAACRQRGLNYSKFIHGLKLANIELDRRTLSELAVHDPAAFDAVFEKAQAALAEEQNKAAAAATAS